MAITSQESTDQVEQSENLRLVGKGKIVSNKATFFLIYTSKYCYAKTPTNPDLLEKEKTRASRLTKIVYNFCSP